MRRRAPWRRSEHGSHLGACVDIPDLADGERHNVRIEYDPVLAPDAAAHPSFKAAPHLVGPSGIIFLSPKFPMLHSPNSVYYARIMPNFAQLYPLFFENRAGRC